MHAEPLAHVKWFTDPSLHPTQYGLLLSPQVLAALALAALAIGGARWIQHRYPEPEVVRLLERFAGTGQLVLGLHLGVALVVAAIFGLLFVPSLRVQQDALGFALLVVEGMCGVMVLLGLATRAAAVLLALLGIVAMQPFSFESILEQVHILGIAMFLFLVGRGPISLDRIRGVRPPIARVEVPRAALALIRLAMGFGILYGALTEKLLNPELSQALLNARPSLNPLAAHGLPDALFVWAAGATELAIGAVIMSGQLTRPVMFVGAVIFTVSLPFFDWAELLGHLPFYGIFFLLLIAPNADSWRVRSAFRPAA